MFLTFVLLLAGSQVTSLLLGPTPIVNPVAQQKEGLQCCYHLGYLLFKAGCLLAAAAHLKPAHDLHVAISHARPSSLRCLVPPQHGLPLSYLPAPLIQACCLHLVTNQLARQPGMRLTPGTRLLPRHGLAC